MALKIIKRPKNIYQFITNLFFLTTIPTSGLVSYHIKKNLTSSRLHSWSTGVTERYLLL